MKNEEWKSLGDYSGYEISNLGRVRSVKRTVRRVFNGRITGYRCRELILRLSKTTDGYSKALIKQSSKNVNIRIGRWVATIFIRPPVCNEQVNHINGIKTDDRVENLEWCTPSENTQHAYDTGLAKKIIGERNSRSKLKNADRINIIKSKDSRTMLSEKYNVSRRTISYVINNKNKYLEAQRKVKELLGE